MIETIAILGGKGKNGSREPVERIGFGRVAGCDPEGVSEPRQGDQSTDL